MDFTNREDTFDPKPNDIVYIWYSLKYMQESIMEIDRKVSEIKSNFINVERKMDTIFKQTFMCPAANCSKFTPTE